VNRAPLLLALAVACSPSPGRVEPTGSLSLWRLIQASDPVPVDSAILRQIASRAHLPLPERPVAVYIVRRVGAFACAPYRCRAAYIAAPDGETDLIFVAEHAPRLALQHELLHYLTQTRDNVHGPIFQMLGLDENSID